MAPDDWEHYIIMSQIGRQLAQADSFSWCVGWLPITLASRNNVCEWYQTYINTYIIDLNNAVCSELTYYGLVTPYGDINEIIWLYGTQSTIPYDEFENHTLKHIDTSPRGQWVDSSALSNSGGFIFHC